MHGLVAGIMAVLGTLLVLAGAAVVILKGLDKGEPAGIETSNVATTRLSPSARVLGLARRIEAADRLIIWGIVLLVLAAVAVGAIQFNLGAAAGSK